METINRKIRVALAGNANVGKSVIFNYFTGLHQHIGNWPGKTIERAEGSVYFRGYEIEIIDLPGIYSLSAYSLEEIISREYLIKEKPDVILNVLDGSVLERNLFFTLQLMELAKPMIVLINQVDIAESKGITIDYEKLEGLLGIPVIPTIATKGIGMSKTLECIIEVYEGQKSAIPNVIPYGQEIERQLKYLQKILETDEIALQYPQRWLILKLLEEDKQIVKLFQPYHHRPFLHFRESYEVCNRQSFQYHDKYHKTGQYRPFKHLFKRYMPHESYPDVLIISRTLASQLEELHGHSYSNLITSERYNVINTIIDQVQRISTLKSPPLRERIDKFLLHPILGYLVLFGIVLGVLYGIFTTGDIVSGILSDTFESMKPNYKDLLGTGIFAELLWGGLEGIMGGITIAFPYILPFYLILAILEDSGYMTRITFMMDRLMHTIGLHGKAFIPCMLGIGCNVPGCLGCRIMERQRERLLTAFIVTLVPCAAQTVIILALVGKYVGFLWVIALYLFEFLVILVLGRIAFKVIPGEAMGLIMEMVSLRRPNMKVVITQTYFRLKEFIYIALPLIVAGSIFLKILEVLKLLDSINMILSPITVFWLDLPEETGIALIFGITRKELAVILLGTLFGTTDLGSVMTPIQMIVFSLVTMLYIPCIATIAALKKEFQWKKTLLITGFEIIFALIVGGIVVRLLLLSAGNLGL
ncbi:MAG: ferrous iron transport protein B [Promethearchaeota archaeon]